MKAFAAASTISVHRLVCGDFAINICFRLATDVFDVIVSASAAVVFIATRLANEAICGVNIIESVVIASISCVEQ